MKKYIADDRDALFGKPLDLVNGSFDWQVLPYMELKWQTGVLIFGENGLLEGGVADIDEVGKLNMVVPDAESVEVWRERSPALRNLFTSIFGGIVGKVTASKRKEE